jgi:plastocyanin domain-containing protein
MNLQAILAALLLLSVAGFSLADPKGKPGKTVQMSVTDKGFEPAVVDVKKGEPVTLVITRKTAKTCATDIVIDEVGVKQPLPLNTPTTVTFTPPKSGELKYGCAMGKMVGGVLKVQ